MKPSAPYPFEVTLKRTHRRKTVAIQVFPDGKVVVSVPNRVSSEKVALFLQEKQNWIQKALEKFAALGPKKGETQFHRDEVFHYLGSPKKLNILRVGRHSPQVDQENLHVYLSAQSKPEVEKVRIKTALEKWYKQQAHEICQARVLHFSTLMNLFPKKMVIKNHRTRWGTCKSGGEISFNWRLSMAPIHLIDYVVVHELAHLKHHHHRAEFWNLVKQFYADPTGAKKELQSRDHRGELRF